jgi:hypothetical protein
MGISKSQKKKKGKIKWLESEASSFND